jgi:membrane protein DedA with SNARE-associated domain
VLSAAAWWQQGLAWTQAVLAGMASPGVIALVLALTTLLLEDLAIAAGVVLATQGAISWELSLLAVGGGIALGDLGLYGLGVAAQRLPWLQRRTVGPATAWARDQLRHRLAGAVLLARVIPGLRLATYTACGYLAAPLAAFAAWVTLAVAIWTVGLFLLSAAAGQVLASALGLPPALAVAIPIVLLALLPPLWRRRRRLHRRVKP